MGANSSKQVSVDQLVAAIQRSDARSVSAIASKQLKKHGSISLHNVVAAVAQQSSNHAYELLKLILVLVTSSSMHGDPADALKTIDMRRGDDGATPLMLACELGDATAAELLIAFGADLRLRDKKHDRTCLHYAVLANKPHMISLLVDREQGHRSRHSDRRDSVPLFKRISAQMRDSLVGTKNENDNTAFIDMRARSSFNALMYACFFNYSECVTQLMQNGVLYKARRGDRSSLIPDPSCLCYIPYGASALHICALRGHYDAAWALLSAYFNSLSPVWVSEGYRVHSTETGVARTDPRLLIDSTRRTPFELARQMDLFHLLPLLNPVTPISLALDDRDHRLLGPLTLKKIAAIVAQAVLLEQVAGLSVQLVEMKRDLKDKKKNGQKKRPGKEAESDVSNRFDIPLHQEDCDLRILSSRPVLLSPSSSQQGLEEMLRLQMSFSEMLVQQEKRLAAMMTQMLAAPVAPRTMLNQIPEIDLSGPIAGEGYVGLSGYISGSNSPAMMLSRPPTMLDNITFDKSSQPLGSSPVQGMSPPYYTSGQVPFKPSQTELQQHIYDSLMALVAGVEEDEDEEGADGVGQEDHDHDSEVEARRVKNKEEEQVEVEVDPVLLEAGESNKKKAAGDQLDKTLAAARSHRLVHGVNTSNLYGVPLVSAPPSALQESPSITPTTGGGANTSIFRNSHGTHVSDRPSRRSSMLRQRLNQALGSSQHDPPPSLSPSDSITQSHATDEGTCGVCFDEGDGFIAILPCKHKICCPCAKELIALHPTDPIPCPFCRGLVRGFELCDCSSACFVCP